MADDLQTIADLVAFELGLAHNELMELKAGAPMMAVIPAILASDGTVHKYVKTTALPVVGSRPENEGRDLDKHTDETVTENCVIVDWSSAVDKAVADSRGRDLVVGRQEMMHITAAMFYLEQQTINGTANDANGFNGWRDNSFIDALSDEMVINAGGATNLTSCYLIRSNEMEVAAPYQGDSVGRGDTIVQEFRDPAGKSFPAYYTPGCGWFASQIGSKYSMARIANIDDSANPLTDDLIYQAAALLPAGQRFTHAVMSPRSLEQVRNSRTTFNQTGAPAPTPTIVGDNITVVSSDGVSNAEAVVA